MTAATSVETFDPVAIAGLPEPARRWLGHAIAPGTPLWSSVELTMHGQIKLGRWRPFTARQILTPPGGYTWAARTRLAGLPVTGYDRLASGGGASTPARRSPPGGSVTTPRRPSSSSSRTAGWPRSA